MLGDCPHKTPFRGTSAPSTLGVNEEGTHQVCVFCTWKRPLKKRELAFRAWAKKNNLLGNPVAIEAFMAGWEAKKRRGRQKE